MSARGVTILRDDPHVTWEGALEFRLTYEGILLAETGRDDVVRRSRATHKQEIRKALHPQLRRLWNTSPYLTSDQPNPGSIILGNKYDRHSIEGLSQNFAKFGYNFVPLATRELEVFCSVDILFLRFGEPGHLINRKGDVDNRLKTLFDALTVPRTADQLGSYRTPTPDEVPFFCLLEDDSIITRASVESDVLLQPVSDPPSDNDARVVMTVKIRPGRVKAENIGFA